jgi:mRNA-degrading endonuclease HigB of HigAB toxin-antitoxin module
MRSSATGLSQGSGEWFRKNWTPGLPSPRAEWRNSAELKAQDRSASIISAERVVFNVKGNDYRLIAAIDYQHGIVLIVWLGTHREYDRIDPAKITFDKERYAHSTHSN